MGDEMRDVLMKVIIKNLKALDENDDIDDSRKQLAEETIKLLDIEAKMKASDTTVYTTQENNDRRDKEIKTEIIRLWVDGGLKLASILAVLIELKSVMDFETTGTISKTFMSFIPKIKTPA